MDVRSKVYTYRTKVRWTDRKQGVSSVEGKPDLPVATPPEFKGHEGIWSPEDLFVASVNVCVMSTFLAFAERAALGFTEYSSEAEGTVEFVDGKLRFTTVVVRPRVVVKQGEDQVKAKELLEKAEAHCLISNSVACRVTLDPTVQ